MNSINRLARSTSRALPRLVAPALAMLALTACATTGVGTGSTRNNDLTATFTWKSTNDRTGTLTANLNNGQTFNGKFFQIGSESRIEDLGPLWGGWRRGWGGWGYWDPMRGDAFITHYSGKVVANLDGPDSEHMRCRFTLIRPSSGMAGGGEGKCQLPSGKDIDANFPSA
jgi:hypothetical protein